MSSAGADPSSAAPASSSAAAGAAAAVAAAPAFSVAAAAAGAGPSSAAPASSAAAAAAAGASAGSVFVKRAGDARAHFARVPILVGDAVTDLAERASLERVWGVDAAYVEPFLVPDDRVRDIQLMPEHEAGLLVRENLRLATDSLDEAGIRDCSCLLARLPDPPAAAPGECARAARSLLSCLPSRGPEGLAGRARDSGVVFAGRSPFSDLASLPSFAGGGTGGSSAAAAAGGGSGGGGSSSEPAITFERLLEDGGMRRSTIEASTALRARLKYGFLVLQALLERRPDLAVEAYELGKR
jgi:hypothetical protein